MPEANALAEALRSISWRISEAARDPTICGLTSSGTLVTGGTPSCHISRKAWIFLPQTLTNVRPTQRPSTTQRVWEKGVHSLRPSATMLMRSRRGSERDWRKLAFNRLQASRAGRYSDPRTSSRRSNTRRRLGSPPRRGSCSRL